MLACTFFVVNTPAGPVLIPVNMCFAVIQYSRLSTSIEKVVPRPKFVSIIKVRNSELVVTRADWPSAQQLKNINVDKIKRALKRIRASNSVLRTSESQILASRVHI